MGDQVGEDVVVGLVGRRMGALGSEEERTDVAADIYRVVSDICERGNEEEKAEASRERRGGKAAREVLLLAMVCKNAPRTKLR